MTKIYEIYTKFNNKVHMFGEPNQCSPVEGGSQIHYNYLRSITIEEMGPQRKTLKKTIVKFSIYEYILFTGCIHLRG